jgi:hypothetical protein
LDTTRESLGSHNGPGEIDLTNAQWRKSVRSGPNCDNCVEVAFVDGATAVRNSKDPTGPVVIFTPGEWGAFIGGVRDGEFDLPA